MIGALFVGNMPDNAKILELLQSRGYEIVILDSTLDGKIEITHTFIDYALKQINQLITEFATLDPMFVDPSNTVRFIEAKAELIRSLKRMSRIKRMEITHETGNADSEAYIPD